MKTEVAKLKKKLRENKPPKKIDWTAGLSSGLTLVNLLITGKTNVAFLPGFFYLFVGASKAGKTWLLKLMMAEATINERFDGYRLIEDCPERGDLMDVERFFGKRLAMRLDTLGPEPSKTLQQFYDRAWSLSQSGDKFILGLDSEDALDDENEVRKAGKNRKAREAPDGEVKGSYGGVGKAKENSSRLRTLTNNLPDTGSILVIIKQARDRIGFGAMFDPETRSGGRALTFYATVELWFSVVGKLKRTVKGKKRVIGSILRVKVKKNRVSGRESFVDLHFYPRTGFDDIGSMVNWLIAEGKWKGSKVKVDAPEFEFDGTREELIEKIEAEGKERQLRMLVAEHWRAIDEACSVKRKSRYG
jgi:hypothetical protein